MRKVRGNIVLANTNNLEKMILESYDEVVVDNTVNIEGVVGFRLFGKEFLLFCPDRKKLNSTASIFLLNDTEFDFPHILLKETVVDENYNLPKGKYRTVCLHERDNIITSLQSYEEKIIDAIERLIMLMKMTPLEREKELQKEFMYYWNQFASGPLISIYLGRTKQFSKLDVYQNNSQIRYVDSGVHLNDLEHRNNKGIRVWQHHIEMDVFYIPIEDIRGIVPPSKRHEWGVAEIIDILYGKRISHINSETYRKVKSQNVKTQNIALVFEMNTGESNVTFVVKIKCKNSQNKILLQRIQEDAIGIEVLYSRRLDYMYLNNQIGNDVYCMDKNILLIGAGSLGSYVATELVKNGCNQLTIYDGDDLNDENTMRWAYGAVGKGKKKTIILQMLLNLLHPEINVTAVDKNIDENMLVNEIQKTDLIISTVGSSDVQLEINRILTIQKSRAPVIYVWLEAGGEYSHILVVQYEKKGCYECLFTDERGNLVNNKANMTIKDVDDKNILRNGCGGTRAAYGTSIILRTTSVLLDTLYRLSVGEISENCLIDITSTSVIVKGDSFIEKECFCCGKGNN